MTAFDPKALFDTIRRIKGSPLTQDDVEAINAVVSGAPAAHPQVTTRVALEIVSHEAIVQEAYKDSVDVWTWGVGITAASGVDVLQYKDNPQPLETCLAAFVDRLYRRYVPAVRNAFAGHPLTEAQFGAALSFHFNTGAIEKADWVRQWKSGARAEARISFMNWRKPPEIIPRREKERDLFFDGKWSNDGTALVIPVSKPSYQPAFARSKRVDIRAALEATIGGRR